MTIDQLADRLPAAGFIAGAIAWGISTELNYALAPKVCATHWPLVPAAALVLMLVGAGGAALSVRAWRKEQASPSPSRPEGGVSRKLLAGIGVLAGLLFTLIIAMQGLAAFFLSGCE